MAVHKQSNIQNEGRYIMFCLNCKQEFEEDMAGVGYEDCEVWGRPCSISYKKCPYCGSDSLVADNEYHYCDCCGEVCEDNYIKTEDGSYFCEDCYTVHNIGDNR